MMTPMRRFDCPQCGAPVVFHNATAEAAVCEFCQSMVVRNDVNIAYIGKVATVPPDMSPLQVGARGTLDGVSFSLLGRVRVGWDGGSWNEWFAEFSDGKRGWIGDSQGFFMVLKEQPPLLPGIKLPGDYRAGQRLELGANAFKVIDAKNVTCIGVEGELPHLVRPGDTWMSVDMEGSRPREVATLEHGSEKPRLFLGKTASFEELDWKNLRQVAGWNGVPTDIERGKTQAFTCPSCRGEIRLRATGLSMSAVCSRCGGLLDTSHPQVALLSKADEQRKLKPVIPLGARGVLDGVEWENIGFMQRRDQYAAWMEYLLYNPFHGFLWLTEYNGHWIKVHRLLTSPGNGQNMDYEGKLFKLYSGENARVTYVEGEFYWRVSIGEKAHVQDFIAPPFVLSRETYEGLVEITWSKGEHIEPAVLSKAFTVPLHLFPSRTGVGIVQPNPHGDIWPSLKPVMMIALVALLAVQIFTGRSCSSKKEYATDLQFSRPVADSTNAATSYMINPTPQAPTSVTEPFKVTSQGGVEVNVQAPVNNNWLGMDLELINQETGQRYSKDTTVEFYHGTDSDGAWTEGSHSSKAIFPGVPPGTYTLAINADADSSIKNMNYSIDVTSGNRYFSNFILGALALLFYPMYVGAKHFSFESLRWS